MKTKSFLGTVIFVLIMLLVAVMPVFAQVEPPGEPPPVMQSIQLGDVGTIISELVSPAMVKQLLTLTGLILLQVVLAVALAIREKTFEWKKLADFYRVMVLPLVIGWLEFALVIKLISVDMLGPTYNIIIGDSVTWLAWLAVVTSLGARIVETAKSLYGAFMPFKEPEANGLGRG